MGKIKYRVSIAWLEVVIRYLFHGCSMARIGIGDRRFCIVIFATDAVAEVF